MDRNLPFLANYYLKNLVLMKLIGRCSVLRLGATEGSWKELREQVQGHDVWLAVGNGPSLRLQDLEAFHELGVPSIASNKINMLYGRTAWRPTLYTIADPLLLHKLPAGHYASIGQVLLPHTHSLMARTGDKLPWRHLSNTEGEKRYLGTTAEVSPLNGMFIGGTITVPNLQLAIWAGAKVIYVIGCDHFYANESSTVRSRKAAHWGKSNHFDPTYRKPGEIVFEAPVSIMNRGYAVMRRIAEERCVQIINISRRTALEAFACDTVENALSTIRGLRSDGVRHGQRARRAVLATM